MEQTANKRRNRNVWLVPLTVLLLIAAAFLGFRTWQQQQQEAREQYQRELEQFGQTEMNVPVLSPSHFARRGEEVVGDVKAILEDPQSSELAKTQAMEVLLLVLEEEATPILIEQAETRSSPLRERAIGFLGRTESGEAADYLVSLTEGQETAETALAALGEMPAQARQHQESILSLLDHSDRRIASRAALTAGSLGTPEAEAALLEKLDSSALAIPAARGLARMQNDAGIETLLAVVQGKTRGDRKEAEAGLIEAESAAAERVDSLLDQEERSTIISALRILRHIGEPEDQERWARFLESDDREIRQATLEALEANPTADGGRAAFELLVRENGQLDEDQAALAERVARLSAPDDFQFYEEKLESTEPVAQRFAVRIIGYTGNPQAIELLIETLSAESAAIRREAAMSLGRLHGTGQLGDAQGRVRKRVEELAENDPDPEVRQMASSLLVVLR